MNRQYEFERRWQELERRIRDLHDGKVCDGDPAEIEGKLLEEQDAIEYEIGMEQFMPATIDDAVDWLRSRRWSVGDIAFEYPSGIRWVVYCDRGAEKFTASAPSQTEAWLKACVIADEQ